MAANFDPADISGLVLRYDIDSLATADGTRLSQLIDSSGLNHSLLSYKDPTGYLCWWTNNLIELNNKGFLQFRLDSGYTTNFAALSQPNTVFLVARINVGNGANDGYIFDSTNANGSSMFAAANGDLVLDAGTHATVGKTNWQWIVYEIHFNGESSSVFTNGVSAWSGNLGQNPVAGMWLGKSYASANGDFDISYLLVYNANLSQSESSNVVQWLNTSQHVFGYTNVAAGPPWYASPTGKNSSDADGSINNPWDIRTAFAATNSIQPGHTLYLRGGTYTNYTTHANLLLAGTSNNPITIRPYGSEKVIITVAAGAANQQGEIVTFNGSGCILRDVEIVNSETNRWAIGSPYGTYAVGVGIYGVGNKLINCIIHDTGEGVWIGSDATNTEVYGCWIFNNGSQNLSTTNLDGSARNPDSRGHGHGVYARSPAPTTLLADNIVFNQFGLGFQCYSTSSSVPLNGIRLEGNVSFGNGRLSQSGDGECNFLVAGGGLVDNLLVYTNFSFALGYSCGEGVHFGSGSAGDTRVGEGSAVIAGNHFLGGTYNYVNTFTNLVFTNNYLAGNNVFWNYNIWYLTYSDPGSTTIPAGSDYTWNWNIYNNSSGWPSPFLLSTNASHSYTYAQWKTQTGFDANSSYSTDDSTEVEVYVRTNDYDPNRAHVIVINWTTNNTVSADLSVILQAGDAYRIFNGQNPLSSPILSGNYDGPLLLPMTNLSAATPVGVIAPPTSGPEFNVFVLTREANPVSTIGSIRAGTFILRK